ncbi:MAG: DUF938 domain-containing protein [Pseudomonadota bacterium]
MTAPAAGRNQEAILRVLLPYLPRTGAVLEIASGTGQHVAALAAHRPDLVFYPTDPDPARRLSIDAWCKGLTNVVAAGDLDACTPGWAEPEAVTAIVVINLLHLISDAEMSVLLDEVAKGLAPGGVLAIYGPFLREGQATSDGDRRFDDSLRAQDPAVGYKDIQVLRDVLPVLGLTVDEVEMPANNVMILARKAVGGL